MRKKLFASSVYFLCFMISLFFVIPAVKAQEEKEENRKITTSGEAKVWIDPDRARVFLGIETMKETIGLARDENANKIKEVMEALKTLRIKDMLIKAPSYNVALVKESERHATKSGRLPQIIGYKVRQEFTVLLQNKDTLNLSKNAARVVDTALDNGVNIIQQVLFFKEDDSQDRRSTLELAVKDAISNAKAIAKTAGVSIRDYSQINSTIHYWQPPRAYMRQSFAAHEAFRAPGVPTTLVAGKISIACKVTLHCLIE